MPGACVLTAFLAAGGALAAAKDLFVDAAAAAGVDFVHQPSKTTQKYLPETMSGGVALFDYDGDGFLDIYLVNGALIQDPMPAGAMPDKTQPRFWNRLYRNRGDATFEDVTREAGVQGKGTGKAWLRATTTASEDRTSMY